MNVKSGLLIFATILMIGSLESRAQETIFREEDFLGLYMKVRDIVFNATGRTGTPRGLRRAAELDKLQHPVGLDVPFPCNTSNGRSPVRPTSVHMLKPGDIDVIAAMGDSLTAGNGAAASHLFHVVTENRGIAWSIGGQGDWRQFLTLPNILKQFNPNIFGYSVADSLTHHRESQFNVAEAGSMSRDMPYMARILVKRIKADRRVDFKNDWKLVTLMIGANDFCADVCYLPEEEIKRSPDNHRRDLMKALDYLQNNLPRTLVNLVVPPNIEIVHGFRGKSNLCTMTHLFLCPCMFGSTREAKVKENIAIQRQWQEIEEEVAKDPKYRKKSDFAVVMQPFTLHLNFPQKETSQGKITDFTYLSEDCFHFSQKGYARAANALWNNMLEPTNAKSTDWTDAFRRFLCPTEEHPYFYTMDNSQDLIDIRSLT